MKFRQSIALATLSFALALAAPANAIVGPTLDASPFADEVVMVLMRGPQGSGFCTGVVLSPTVVLTAAHCLRPAGDMLVHYRDAGGSPIVVDVVATKANPAFRPDAAVKRSISLDVGLIETKTPLPSRFRAAVLATGASPDVGEVGDRSGLWTIPGAQVIDRGDPARRNARRPRTALSGPLVAPRRIRRGRGMFRRFRGPYFQRGRRDGGRADRLDRRRIGRKCGKLTQGVLLAPLSDWILQTAKRLTDGG